MIWKITPKNFTDLTGNTKTITGINLYPIEVNRERVKILDSENVPVLNNGNFTYNERLIINFSLSFEGTTVDRTGEPQSHNNDARNLHIDYLIRSTKETILSQIISPTPEDIINAENTAKSQIIPLVSALLVGTFAQAYTAASALASQYNYTLLPIEEQ